MNIDKIFFPRILLHTQFSSFRDLQCLRRSQKVWPCDGKRLLLQKPFEALEDAGEGHLIKTYYTFTTNSMVQLRIVVHVQERKTQPFIRIFIEHNFLFAQKHNFRYL